MHKNKKMKFDSQMCTLSIDAFGEFSLVGFCPRVPPKLPISASTSYRALSQCLST
jgi:hypothetical protein